MQPNFNPPTLTMQEVIDELREAAEGSIQFMKENPIEHGVANVMRRQIVAFQKAAEYIQDDIDHMNGKGCLQ